MATNTQLSRLAIAAIAVLLLLPVVMMLFAWPMMGMGWWMHGPVDGQVGPGGSGGATPTWMFGFWIVGLLVLVGAGYLLYRWAANETTDPALEELRRAYARGELSEEEFEQRRRRLRE
ncbi:MULTISPECIES: SHOCT domain-containing protein [Halorussus]|uniref:SHOCT domain-containing protein n=1 Tax=Halorussus TaxID=1070314 RepID=UPI000E2115DE|nr:MULTISPECIES: SHOCT domain-containing protein [Halorussus]NHN61242.1 SHOCT domain-containing protein [Halorussus sp. JP-T4]